MTVFPIPKRFFLAYYVAILVAQGAQAKGPSLMANTDRPGTTARTRAVGQASEEQLTRQHDGTDQANQTNFAGYSFSSPEFRQSLRQIASNSTSQKLDDPTKTFDPCTKQVVDRLPAPADRPQALDSVKDRDPELYKQIQAKVTDPRYTGELGNITVSTHDKKGRVNGCEFVQNVPYWQSGPAAQSLVDVNRELATRGKRLEADPLNGAGRTLGQEEAIVWRNSGLHAKVGKSNHGFGKAEDFKPDPDPNATLQPWDDPFVNATLHAHGWRQGDTWGPLKNDLHHWSFVGPGPATDGPPPSKPVQSHHRNHHHRP